MIEANVRMILWGKLLPYKEFELEYKRIVKLEEKCV